MKSYVVTPNGQRDLQDIVDFIARHSPDNALKVFDKIHAAVRKLAGYPGRGHRRDDRADEVLRVWSVYSFLVISRPQIRPRQFIRILHGARDIGSILGADAEGRQ